MKMFFIIVFCLLIAGCGSFGHMKNALTIPVKQNKISGTAPGQCSSPVTRIKKHPGTRTVTKADPILLQRMQATTPVIPLIQHSIKPVIKSDSSDGWLVAAIVLTILILLGGGAFLVSLAFPGPTWWMLILAAALLYAGICCAIGFIALAFGGRNRGIPDELK